MFFIIFSFTEYKEDLNKNGLLSFNMHGVCYLIAGISLVAGNLIRGVSQRHAKQFSLCVEIVFLRLLASFCLPFQLHVGSTLAYVTPDHHHHHHHQQQQQQQQ